jgi:hypothetical protein
MPPILANDAIEPIEAAEPTDPIDSAEPIEPIESTDPTVIDRTEPLRSLFIDLTVSNFLQLRQNQVT